jgi:hypothetical protein
MTSRRRRKRTAQSGGLTEAELDLVELLEEILDAMRWAQVLGYANQFLLQEQGAVSPADRDRVLEAAAAIVEGDGRIQDWRARLHAVRSRLTSLDQELRRRRGGSAPPEREAAGG